MTVATLAGGLLLAMTQQVADVAFDTSVARPAYPNGGPVVAIDEGHRNFHTAEGRYSPFAGLLRADGYRVRSHAGPFTAASLADLDVLVIANARGGVEGDPASSYERAAFDAVEVEVVRTWVERGGRLLLIADHAPFGIGSAPLARAFGVEMGVGYTADTGAAAPGFTSPSILLFSRDAALIADHPITAGRDDTEHVDTVLTFAGQSLKGPEGSAAFLVFRSTAVDHAVPTPAEVRASPNPGAAWFTAVEGKPTTPAAGRAQGIAFSYGRGRVVVLGEAAMLSAQVAGAGARARRIGMNTPGGDNRQLALNILHWLTDLLP